MSNKQPNPHRGDDTIVDDCVRQAAIDCTTGLAMRPNVSAHLHVHWRHTECHLISVCFVDDKGTKKVSNDTVHSIEFDVCVSYIDLPTAFFRSETILEMLAETNEMGTILESPTRSAEILHDLLTSNVAHRATLDIDCRPVDDGEGRIVVVEIELGGFRASTEISMEVASLYFIIDERHVGDDIDGDPFSGEDFVIDEGEDLLQRDRLPH